MRCLWTTIIILAGCVQSPPPLETGEYKVYSTVTVQDEWCYMPDGSRANGVVHYNTRVRSISTICVSLRSDDPERTLRHELAHAGRNAIGLTAISEDLP